jgi:hypothetical protein
MRWGCSLKYQTVCHDSALRIPRCKDPCPSVVKPAFQNVSAIPQTGSDPQNIFWVASVGCQLENQ